MHSAVGSLNMYGDAVWSIISFSEALAKKKKKDGFISVKEGGQIQLEKVAT